MEKLNSQNSSMMGTVGVNDECLFYPTSPNERMIQENLQKVQKGTQTTLMPPLCNSKIPRSNSEYKTNAAQTETQNDSVVNATLYESFTAEESKYDSFDDSLDEGAHLSPKVINVSNFLSEQVNVTVRKVRERQKAKGSNLCDSLEDICSLVSNAEHISNSDEIEYINNVLEKHGICEDSLRNDVCYDNRNASLAELNFDDDSLAILEIEKPFDDSLEDVDVVSCVDSLMILGNSIGDGDFMMDKLVSESCGTRNLIETSVQIIYENAPLSSDESFRTAENFDSNKNSLSDCPMSRDSLEEIHDISEIACSEMSSNIPLKTGCDGNELCPAEKTAALEGFDGNIFECEVKQKSSEQSLGFQNRTSNAESERTSSVVNSCYFYDTFCMDDSMQLPPGSEIKDPKNEVSDLNYSNESNLKVVGEDTEKLTESKNENFSCPSNLQEIDENQTTGNTDISSTTECLGCTDTTDNICIKGEKESAILTSEIELRDKFNKSTTKFIMNKDMNSPVTDDSKLPPVSSQSDDVSSISGHTSEKECSESNVDRLKIQVVEADSTHPSHSSQFLVADKLSKKFSQHLHDSVSGPTQKSVKNISTCVTVSPSLGKFAQLNDAATKTSCKNEAFKNSKSETDQMNLKLHIELAINKNCDVNVVSVSSVERDIQNEANMLSEKSCVVVNDNCSAKNNDVSNQTNQLETANSISEIDAVEKIMTEAHKKIPTLPNIPERKNCYDNQQKFEASSPVYSDDTVQIKLVVCDAQLLKALDLHDSSCSYPRQRQLQSRDSIMPLNLCVRDLSPEKKNDILLESKENIPYIQKIKESPTETKAAFLHSKIKSRDLKKGGGKPYLITKIPIRKAESPLSIPLNQKQIKQDLKSPCGGKQLKASMIKSSSIDSIGKSSLDEMSKKHHFCMVRNSICRVPKSLEKPNAKKFQNIQSPVAKYIGNPKVHSPLKTTHRYDGNFISPLPSKLTPKATGSVCTSVSEATVPKKVVRRLKS